MNQTEFEELVQQLQKGNNSGLSFIFEDHADFCIQNLMRKMQCTKELAEDVLMDAVINFRDKAIEGKITYMTNVRNYIYTVCVNMVRVYYKNQQRVRDKHEEVQMYLLDDDNNESLHEYEQGMINMATQALKLLDGKCQKLLTYFYVNDMRLNEIAEKMGFANANVAKTSKSRCYKKWMDHVRDLQNIKNTDYKS